MNLLDILAQEQCLSLDSTLDLSSIEVTSVAIDSRAVTPGAVFFAVLGENFDGRVFIDAAFKKGAAAVVYSGELQNEVEGISIQVKDVRFAISYAASKFYSEPSKSMKNIAITGTSGKTSTAWILSLALTNLKQKTLMGGTLGYQLLIPEEKSYLNMKELNNTSIEPEAVQNYLADAKTNGASYSVFEVTSQGIEHNRMRHVDWNVAIFTNFSRDHLDLHGSMENYLAAKKKLFVRDLVESSKQNKLALFNYDDEQVRSVVFEMKSQVPSVNTLTISTDLESKADYLIENLEADVKGVRFNLTREGDSITITSALVGRHNVYNLAFAAATLKEFGFSSEEIGQTISELPVPPGRLEPLPNEHCSIFVDYAHKPDALEKVLQFMKPLCKGQLISIVGCGGDRDKGKRPIMGKISSDIADLSIITSDNPRTEDPQEIIDEIVAGVEINKRDKIVIEVDRRAAIFHAINIAQKDDVIIIAGKGHEPYQEIHGVKHDFKDLDIAKEALAAKA